MVSVSGFGGSWFRDLGFPVRSFRGSAFRVFEILRFVFWVSCFRVSVSGFLFWGFEFRVFEVRGFGFGVSRFGILRLELTVF